MSDVGKVNHPLPQSSLGFKYS